MSLSKKILLVEDDLDILNIYRLKLRISDYTVQTAHNGLEALRTLEEFKPDIILLDLMMPIMGGERFLEKFRKQYGPDMKIIILTNVSRSEAPRTLWHLGIDGYFVKAHHTPSQLIEEINRVLKTDS